MASVYLSLGSNLGDRHALMVRAIDYLARRVGRLMKASSFFQTEPWGFQSPHTFLNAVVLLQTDLSPLRVLEETQAIERLLGRNQKSTQGHYADRTMDIDILLYDDLHIHIPGLVIPHPLMYERDFVMRPLAELLGNSPSPPSLTREG